MVKKSKYNVDTSDKGKTKRTFEGIVFDSEIEMKAYRDYFLPLQSSGEIVEIKLQPKYVLQPKYEKYGKKILPINYVADFEVTYKDGNMVIFDIKGMLLQDFKLKRKMFDYVYPDKILKCINYSRLDGGWVDIETIEKGRKQRKKEKSQ
jgi:hypothetical protein